MRIAVIVKCILFFLPLEKITRKAGGSSVITRRLGSTSVEFEFQSSVTECQFTPGVRVLFGWKIQSGFLHRKITDFFSFFR